MEIKDTSYLQEIDNQVLHPWEDFNDVGSNERTIIMEGDGIYVRDSDGNRLIDAPAGMWCLNIGHGRKEMADAIAAQVMQLSYNSPWALASSPAALLAKKMAELSPGDLNHVFFTTGGSTAIDTALRLIAFRNNVLGKKNKKHIINRVNGYHGSTFLASSCSGKSKDKLFMDVDTEHFHSLSDPNPSKRKATLSESEFCDELVAELLNKIDLLGAENIAAFVAEPVLASGGVIIPPADYFKRMAKVCRDNDILVVADEVVTAFGRLGHFFASESVFGVVPDIITTAKGITSGYIPLGAVLVSDQLIEDVANSRHNQEHTMFANGYTYSGHPVACRAALTNIKIIERDQLLENVRSLAGHFKSRIEELASLPLVSDTRVIGLMACVECRESKSEQESEKSVGERIDEHCQQLGLIVRPIYNMCVLSPPLIITREEIDLVVDRLKEGIVRTSVELGIS